jgi:signal transduction histidine kinase
VFYKLVKMTIIHQINTSLITEKEIIEEQIFNFDSVPDFSTVFGHQIEVTIFNHRLQPLQEMQDTLMMNTGEDNFTEYRHLLVRGNLQDTRGYKISIYKSLEDTHKLITDLFLIICLVLILVSLILIVVNYWISRKVWIPFYNTLNKIKDFDVRENQELNLKPAGIGEFNQLNKVLNTMSEKIRNDFINLKEFTEDASHEIQTPLSIIKSKLELLFQSENLTEEQIQNIHSIYEATTRLSKLNNSLLLISKIQNQQYSYSEEVNLTFVLEKFLLHFKEIIQQKNISITKHYEAQTSLFMNPDLAEILISNLLGNAIRHNLPNGSITINLTGQNLIITNTGLPYKHDPNDLFRRFSKGNTSVDSSGLGLSIVKKITSLYNMDIKYSTHENIHILKLVF